MTSKEEKKSEWKREYKMHATPLIKVISWIDEMEIINWWWKLWWELVSVIHREINWENDMVFFFKRPL